MAAERTTVHTVQEVSAMLTIPDSRIIAGGTTFGSQPNADLHLVDISGLEGLDGIKQKGNRIEIGPTAKLCAVGDSALIQSCFPALAEAAGNVGTPEIREQGTIGGNLAAFPAGDIAPALLASGAKLIIKTDCDFRETLVDRFWDQEGHNDLQYDEWITRISLQIPKELHWGAAFGKLGEWDPSGCPSTAAAVYMSLDEKNRVTSIRGGIRTGNGNIRRMFPLEKVLKNHPATDENLEKAVRAMVCTAQFDHEVNEFSAFLTGILQRSHSMAEERRNL